MHAVWWIGSSPVFAAALHDTIPGARIHWRYRIVLNGAAVVVPEGAIPLLRSLPGVQAVDTGRLFGRLDDHGAGRACRSHVADGSLQPGRRTGDRDHRRRRRSGHPYFSPAGYAMPAGYPRGQAAFTTAKVIVARAFAPAGTKWKYARLPFDPVQSGHGTHVAGIAAGNANTTATGNVKVSGIAPRAYIGNYKALSVPTDANVGLDGNVPELVAAIEAAVADGMDVINLSIGEPEVEPSRDLVALALDAAAAAGVVPVVAAGNDFDEFGRGSLSSPGTSDKAITVAAVTGSSGFLSGLADFSASGPTPLSLRLKPDVSAPGVSILSAVPNARWETMSGTSMASPQIAGAAALLIERHPSWSVAMLKAALIGSGSDVAVDGNVAAPTRGGGGLANPLKADVPFVLAAPASRLLRPRPTRRHRPGPRRPDRRRGRCRCLERHGRHRHGRRRRRPRRSALRLCSRRPRSLSGRHRSRSRGRPDRVRAVDARYGRTTHPVLAARHTTRGWRCGHRPASHTRTLSWRHTRQALARLALPLSGGAGRRRVSAVLQGPEQVFRFTLTRPVANFGVVVVRRDGSARVEPRVISAGDENRLTGYAALPVNLNPYLAQFGAPVLAAGAVRPRSGTYDVVFDSPTDAGAGSFGFRFWVDDTKPPTVTLERNRVRRGIPLVVRVADAGSGVDPTTLKVTVDGVLRSARLESGTVRIATRALRRGTHRLRLQVSDYQESRNMENVPPILPNTRVLTTPVVIR